MGVGDFLGNILGTNSNFSAMTPGGDQIANAAGQVQYGYNQQKQFVDALMTANGNTPYDQVNLMRALQQQSAGQGPNPALAQLANTTGQNTANQAALMAGQRGIGSNPALAARNIAMQGSANQQQAAGQAAALRAQQQLAAQQQLGGQLQNMLGTQQNAINHLSGMGLSNQGQLLGSQQSANQINAQIAQGNQQAQNQITGGILGGAGAAFGMAHGGVVPHMAEGGSLGVDLNLPGTKQVPMQNALNLGVDTQLSQAPMLTPTANKYTLGVDTSMPQGAGLEGAGGPKSMLSKFGKGFSGAMNAGNQNNALFQGMSSFTSGALGAGKNLFKPGTIVQNGQETGEMVPKPSFSKGGKVPGKPKVFGDSEKNDTVPAKLSPGEVVIPRSKINDPKKVAQFVNAILGMNLRAA